jgi:general secretion pathway protein G
MLPTLALSPRRSPSRVSGLRSGFTLLEILIALAILGLLVGLAVTKLDKAFSKASTSVANLFVNSEMKTPLTSYQIDMGDYPSTEEGLNSLYVAPAGKTDKWHGPYADGKKLPQDPWQHDYHYAYPGKHNVGSYDLWSSGPDGIDGNDDDIKNW